MCSDTEDQGHITDKREALIRDRKENFQQIADDAQASNRFQLIVAGFATSLTAVFANNDLLTIEELLANRFVGSAIILLSISITTSFLTSHYARKRIEQQSKLLFDGVIHHRLTEEEVVDQLRSDGVRETYSRWLITTSGGITIGSIFLFIVGAIEVFTGESQQISQIMTLMIVGPGLVFLMAIFAALIEKIKDEGGRIWERDNLSKYTKRIVIFPFIYISSFIRSWYSHSVSSDESNNKSDDTKEYEATSEEEKSASDSGPEPEPELSSDQREC